MMDFFKVNKFRKVHKPKLENISEDKPIPLPEEPINENGDVLGKSVNINTLSVVDNLSAGAEEYEGDFISNEVKRRLKESKRNNFMVLIHEEESCNENDEGVEQEEAIEVGSTKLRDVKAEGSRYWSGIDVMYEKYCERMLFYDSLIPKLLHELGCHVSTTASLSLTSLVPSPKSLSKKLLMSLFRRLFSINEPKEETEKSRQLGNDPYQDLEASYVAQICLTWEALHSQYTQLSRKFSHQSENRIAYNQSAQEFQQFHVLLQRYIENEPFHEGSRPEVYFRMRNLLSKLLQVPKIQDSPRAGEEEAELLVLATDLIKIVEVSILTFHSFLKMDKKKPGGMLNLFGRSSQNQMITPVQQIQSSLEKKVIKLKELRKKKKSWKEKSWPTTHEDTQLLLGLIDVEVLSRVLRMVKIGPEQLIWCEEKMKKLGVSDGKLQRDPSPILF